MRPLKKVAASKSSATTSYQPTMADMPNLWSVTIQAKRLKEYLKKLSDSGRFLFKKFMTSFMIMAPTSFKQKYFADAQIQQIKKNLSKKFEPIQPTQSHQPSVPAEVEKEIIEQPKKRKRKSIWDLETEFQDGDKVFQLIPPPQDELKKK
ncbi:hypothetical protein JTE90_018186 [Oedothorax gibbosus]|uniref:Uncharacterized protein n=1 Tax=Oedothorax gibbosus TaxID=931172 RepID=A0AAV6U7N2_9ARAC|nr:hypothetical protein JTE90_018186 [Oedothorax gibbosus]